MKVVELFEGMAKNVIDNTAKELQAFISAKGANLATVQVLPGLRPDADALIIRVMPNRKGGALTKVATRRAIDDYMHANFGKDNLLGVDYTLSSVGATGAYHIRLRDAG